MKLVLGVILFATFAGCAPPTRRWPVTYTTPHAEARSGPADADEQSRALEAAQELAAYQKDLDADPDHPLREDASDMLDDAL